MHYCQSYPISSQVGNHRVCWAKLARSDQLYKPPSLENGSDKSRRDSKPDRQKKTKHICYGTHIQPETTNELDPLKGLTRLLTLGKMERDLRAKAQESYLMWGDLWGNSKRTWLKFSGGDFGLYILLILFVHDCIKSIDTVCIRKTLSPGLWMQKLSGLCIEWKHEHVWCMRYQNGREEKKAVIA